MDESRWQSSHKINAELHLRFAATFEDTKLLLNLILKITPHIINHSASMPDKFVLYKIYICMAIR